MTAASLLAASRRPAHDRVGSLHADVTGGISGERRRATESGGQREQWTLADVCPRHESDDGGHRASRPHDGGLDRTQVACDQQNDVVEVGIVVEAGEPRLIRRAGMSGRREHQNCRSQKKTNEAARNHGARLNEPRRQTQVGPRAGSVPIKRSINPGMSGAGFS